MTRSRSLLILLLGLLALVPATSASARPAALKASLQPTSQRSLQLRRTVRVKVTATRPLRATLKVYARGAEGKLRALSDARVANLRRSGTRTVVIGLTPKGRRSVLGCDPPRSLTVIARRAGHPSLSTSRRLGLDLKRFCPLPYSVGLATRSINPGKDGKFNGGTVYLGGYGIGSPPQITGNNFSGVIGRAATGILGPGIDSRAIVISDGKHSIAIADIQVQGWFTATKDGPLGIVDMRREVERRTKGALPAQRVVIQSDHTHGGPDPIGVWGGVPKAYRKYMFDRTVDAIIAAYNGRHPARLVYGTADGKKLLSNQFGYDHANGNDTLDSDVRVLQARDIHGKAMATLLNFSAHSTVLGSKNTKVTGDWASAANPMLQKRLGGRAMTLLGTLGRTQPADRGCHDSKAKGDAEYLCTESDYAKRVVDLTVQAVRSAKPVGGQALVDGRTYLIEDVANNGAILGFNYGGDQAGIPLNRSTSPPWLTGNVLGTVTGSVRIGNVLLSVIPGEAYPQIPLAVRSTAKGFQGYMTAGLADDQLGYLIAPYSAYPEPVRRSFFNQRGDEVSPLDNDNYAFNQSLTIGTRIRCSLLRGTGEVFGRGMKYRDADSDCAAFPNDLVFDPGYDAKFTGSPLP
jgi:hypothetical protein